MTPLQRYAGSGSKRRALERLRNLRNQLWRYRASRHLPHPKLQWRPPVVDNPPAQVSANDEALCSYLMTLEEGDANKLGVPVPDYCEPYLRSIGRAPRDPDARDPRQILFDLEDRVQIIQMKAEYEALFAPDFGE